MQEEFRKIIENDKYSVSNFGNVKNNLTNKIKGRIYRKVFNVSK